ncbi:hypothetical protein GCM10027046_08330 [Uliginosibacterium flavum]
MDNNDGTITDPRTGLIWQKCAFGQMWNEKNCEGEAHSVIFELAMFAAKFERYAEKEDWRIPSTSEMESLTAPQGTCEDEMERQASIDKKFPTTEVRSTSGNRLYWTSTRHIFNEEPAASAFKNLKFYYLVNIVDRTKLPTPLGWHLLRFVRAGNGTLPVDFENEYAENFKSKETENLCLMGSLGFIPKSRWQEVRPMLEKNCLE